MIAALYVKPGGVYYGLDDVDPWDEQRDARLYDGPYPVVAHPPCSAWCRLAGFREARYGYRRGEDGGCFEAALDAVHRFGGVIAHPAYSAAWDRFNLPEPVWRGGWNLSVFGGATCYVEQGRYGLPVKKATWLYVYGVDFADLPELAWGYDADSAGTLGGGMDTWHDEFKRYRDGRSDQWRSADQAEYYRNGAQSTPHLGITATTPPSFRDVLLTIARAASC